MEKFPLKTDTIKKKKKRPWRQAVRNKARRLRKEKEGIIQPEQIVVETENAKNKKRKKKKKFLKCSENKNEENLSENIKTNSAMNRLEGSRFRFLNEKLYTFSSNEAKELFAEDTEAFDAYHKGYRLQVKKWPMNPVDKIILDLFTLPSSSVIADVGCGDAKIAEKLGEKFKIYSFDLVSKNNRVIAADMSNLPLENESVDVAVYCLSLMGTNLNHFIREANRIIKIGGKLKICEVASRFHSVKKFIIAIEKMGFQLKTKKLLKEYFISFTFIKTEKTKVKRPLGLVLNPCLYKKR